MKKCLITGGAGFIGSHLADHLLTLGNSVTIIDDLSTGSIQNIHHLKSNPKFQYYIEDCRNKALMAELVDEAHEIYHLAAAVGVKLVVENTLKTIHLNYLLTEIVLDLAMKKHKPVFFTSTSEVYGKSTSLPYSEDGDLLLGPTNKYRWSYACSKILDEFLVLSAFERGLPVVIVRLFNTVGPRQSGTYGMVIPTLISQARRNEPIRVFGDGQQSRCFCHVGDVVPMFPKLLRDTRAHGKIFNIGAETETRIIDLAQRIKAITKSASEIQTVPYNEAYNEGFEDMHRRIPSLKRIRSLFDFQPQVSLDDIITDVYQHQHTSEMSLTTAY